MRARLSLECADMSPPWFQSTDMSAHSKASTTRVAEKRKPEANATLAPRPRKQKTVGEAVLFFRSRRLNDVLSPAVPKQPVGEQILPPVLPVYLRPPS